MEKFKKWAPFSLGFSVGCLITQLIFVLFMGKEISSTAGITVTIITAIGLWPILFEKRLKSK